MANWLTRATMVPGIMAAPAAAVAPAAGEAAPAAAAATAATAAGTAAAPQTPRGSVFVSWQALTYPAAVGLIKGAWSALQLLKPALPNVDFTSPLLPFFLSIMVGLLITVSSLHEEKTDLFGWVRGIAIGFLNSCVLFGAVMGLSKT